MVIRKIPFARLVVGCLVASMALAGCGSDEGGSEGSDKLKMALVAPFSGPAAIYGKTAKQVVSYAVEQQNKAGGVEVGGKSYELEVKMFDDKGDPEVAQSVTRAALDDGYEFILGPYTSAAASGTQPIMAQAADALFVLLTAVVEGPTKNPNVFRTVTRIGAYADIALGYIEEHPEIKRVAMITDQNHTGLVEDEKRLVDGIKALGREVVLQQKLQTGDADFRAPITQMMAAKPDLYMLRAFPAESALITKQAAQLGSQVPMQWNAGATSSAILALLDDPAVMEGATQTSPLTYSDPFVAAGNPIAQALVTDGQAGMAGPNDVAQYDGMQIFFAALSEAESVKPGDVAKAMAKLTVASIEGKVMTDYLDQDGLLFKEREVATTTKAVMWKLGTGWVLPD